MTINNCSQCNHDRQIFLKRNDHVVILCPKCDHEVEAADVDTAIINWNKTIVSKCTDALTPWLRHKSSCVLMDPIGRGYKMFCDCGLDDAINELESKIKKDPNKV